MKKKSKYAVIVAAISVSVIMGFLLVNSVQNRRSVVLKVFHAGSLSIPFEEIEKEFEADYQNVDIQLESAGSVQCVSKITETGKVADVLATADWTLIPAMDGQYQEYCIQFAVNKMVVCYTNDSNYASEMNKDNFWKVLQKARWGFANPNLDPCGYRTLMVLQLAELKYGDSTIFENTVGSETTITVQESGSVYRISTPEVLVKVDNPSEHVFIRDKSVDLVTLLKEGGLDFAFEYLSVAKQHGLNYLELDDAVDLSNASLDATYAHVQVLKSDGKTSTGKSITYGITVPKNANRSDLGAVFIEYVINSTGKQAFTRLGQPPLDPCVTTNLSATPVILKPYCVET
ncbi:MAG: tungstate ABC transporter substrate-binding protein WtpA [Promethearchaeota archaeon]